MFAEIFGDFWQVVSLVMFDYYGWVLFAFIILWIGYYQWLFFQIGKYLATIKWVFLEVRVDELNEKSPVAMEQVFASMHAMFQVFSLGEKWTGRVPLHMSAEMVSIGGRISFIFKLPERYRNLLESAIFGQYPKAEIREVQDYLANLPRNYDPATTDFEMWGTQLNKRADSSMPIRTYRDLSSFFEHTDQKSIVDPLAGIIEALSNIHPHELMTFQIVIKPATEEWKASGWALVNKMKGLPPKAAKATIFDSILKIPGAAIDALLEGLGLFTPGEPKKEERPQPLTTSMTDAEKHNIDSIVGGLSKLSFETKIRILYVAPKDKFTKSLRVPEILGAFRNFDNPQLNGLRPDGIRVTTDASFKLFQSLEQPWINHKILVRKNKFLRWFKDRGIWEGTGKTYLNTEELATIYHFPQTPNARVSQIERVQTVKSAPPIDLPLG
jgi:hypothetical protein